MDNNGEYWLSLVEVECGKGGGGGRWWGEGRGTGCLEEVVSRYRGSVEG